MPAFLISNLYNFFSLFDVKLKSRRKLEEMKKITVIVRLTHVLRDVTLWPFWGCQWIFSIMDDLLMRYLIWLLIQLTCVWF